MDSYREGVPLGSRAEHQIGYASLRAKTLRDLLRDKDLGYKDLDNTPHYQLVDICKAEIIRGNLTDLAAESEKSQTDAVAAMRAEMEAKDAAHKEELDAVNERMAKLEALMKPQEIVVTDESPKPAAFHPVPKTSHVPTSEDTTEVLPESFYDNTNQPELPENMKWPALKTHAKAQGINTKGMKRPEILAALAN